MKSKAIILASLILFSLCGCEPTPKIIGLWEFDQSATEVESPQPINQSFYRIRFKTDGSILSENHDSSYSICAWNWEPYQGKTGNLPIYLQLILAEGHPIFVNQILLLFQGLTYDGGFAHKDSFYTSYFYFNTKNQLVIYDTRGDVALVFNRV